MTEAPERGNTLGPLVSDVVWVGLVVLLGLLVVLLALLGFWQLFQFNSHVGWAAVLFFGAAIHESAESRNVPWWLALLLLGVWQLFQFNSHVGWAAVFFFGAVLLGRLPTAFGDVIGEIQRQREEQLAAARAEREEEARREWEAELAEREALRAQRDRED